MCRLRLDDFFVRLWACGPRARAIPPDFLRLNRFAADLCVFIFGTLTPFLSGDRGQDEYQGVLRSIPEPHWETF